MSELEQYDYDLPRELIAQQPLVHRADARLMVVDRARQEVSHYHVRDLPELLHPSDCLVINDTRVVPARVVGYRLATGGHFEGLFLSADEHDNWRMLVKARGKLQPGEQLLLQSMRAADDVRVALLAKDEAGVWLVRPDSKDPALEILQRVGRVPLPHYIRGGQMVDSDRESYQTVYARTPGAVAAPTAGLHFTQDLLRKIEHLGVAICPVTLHVGLDTFRPITADTLEQHAMHSEWGQLPTQSIESIESARARDGRIVAVGTTSVRVLESAAASGRLQAWSGQTNLFIRPPYKFRVVDALLTNFHLPRTTLLVLIYTLGGRELMRHAYTEAIRHQYRFYSYGDAMLIV